MRKKLTLQEAISIKEKNRNAKVIAEPCRFVGDLHGYTYYIDEPDPEPTLSDKIRPMSIPAVDAIEAKDVKEAFKDILGFMPESKYAAAYELVAVYELKAYIQKRIGKRLVE